MKKSKLKIDFGSGYNPQKGYKSCDITYSPTLDYVYDVEENEIIGCEENSVDEFYMRNVVHHIKDLDKTFSCLKRYLKKDGVIRIIDVRKEDYLKNVVLDIVWYRYVIPRYEIWFSDTYRDYFKILKSMNFKLIETYETGEKEVSLWRKL